jgi:hypothetical protein
MIYKDVIGSDPVWKEGYWIIHEDLDSRNKEDDYPLHYESIRHRVV